MWLITSIERMPATAPSESTTGAVAGVGLEQVGERVAQDVVHLDDRLGR